MARPIKTGLSYFPLDCQMDSKIEMLESSHGLVGFGLYIKLLQEIYQHPAGILKINISERFSLWKTMRKRCGLDEKTIRELIDDMVALELFDKEEYEKGYLTSGGVKKRVSKIEEKRQKERKKKQIKKKNYPLRKLCENPVETPESKVKKSKVNIKIKELKEHKKKIEKSLSSKNELPLKNDTEGSLKSSGNFIENLIEIFKDRYLLLKQVPYSSNGVDRKQMGLLAARFKGLRPDYNAEQMTAFATEFFNRCLIVRDNYLNSVTISKINSKFNEYISAIKNPNYANITKNTTEQERMEIASAQLERTRREIIAGTG